MEQREKGDVMPYIFRCPKCNTVNGLNSRFCIGCGEPISVLCPHCRTNLSFGTEFCTNCGLRLDWGTQRPLEERKPTSGWAKFGKVMVVIGILCFIASPVIAIIMAQSDGLAAWEVGLIGRCVIVGILNLSVGVPLMRRG